MSVNLTRHTPSIISFDHIKAVIFDWAGTTIDFGSVAPVKAVISAFQHFGIEVTEAEARQPMGQSKKDHIRAVLQMPRIAGQWKLLDHRSVEADWVDRIYQDFLERQRSILAEHAIPIPGVVECIDKIRSKGVRIGSTTGYTRDLMNVVIPVAASYGYDPEAVVCSDEVGAGRPAPWMNFRAAEILGVYPMSRIVVVDDSVVGIQAAKNAGAIAVGVAVTGNGLGLNLEQMRQLTDSDRHSRIAEIERIFYQAGADLVVDSAADLGEFWEKSSSIAKSRRPVHSHLKL